jgi:hypothetical protein
LNQNVFSIKFLIMCLLCVPLCTKAQDAKNYWTLATTPLSFINPDPNVGLGIGHTNLKLKSTLQLSVGYLYKGNFSIKRKTPIEQIQMAGIISSLNYNYAVNTTHYIGIIGTAKYSELAGLKQTMLTSTVFELVSYKETKVKANLCAVIGTATKYNRLGYYCDFSMGLGASTKHYYQNNSRADAGVALGGAPSDGRITIHGFATLRIGYRVSFARN